MGNQPGKKVRVHTHISTGSVQGVRPTQEDAHIARSLKYHPELLFSAVYDGHGGKEASEFAKRHLHHHIDKQLAKEDDSVRKGGRAAVEFAFLETDKTYFELVAASRPLNLSLLSAGTTANVILLDQLTGTLLAGNVGDTQTVLCRQGRAIDLSVLHKPWKEEEQKRIEAAGHKVANGRLDGTLAVARALGDVRYKPFFAEQLLRTVPGAGGPAQHSGGDAIYMTPHVKAVSSGTPQNVPALPAGGLGGTGSALLSAPAVVPAAGAGQTQRTAQVVPHTTAATTTATAAAQGNAAQPAEASKPAETVVAAGPSPALIAAAAGTQAATAEHKDAAAPATAAAAASDSGSGSGSGSGASTGSSGSSEKPTLSPPIMHGLNFWGSETEEPEQWLVDAQSPKHPQQQPHADGEAGAAGAAGTSPSEQPLQAIQSNANTVLGSLLAAPSPLPTPDPSPAASPAVAIPTAGAAAGRGGGGGAGEPHSGPRGSEMLSAGLLAMAHPFTPPEPSPIHIQLQTPGGATAGFAFFPSVSGPPSTPGTPALQPAGSAPAALGGGAGAALPPQMTSGTKTPVNLTPPSTPPKGPQPNPRTNPSANEPPERWPLTPVPYTTLMAVEPGEGDEFLVLACDGLFDVMSSQAVVDWVRRRFRTKKVQRAVKVRKKDLLGESPALTGKQPDNKDPAASNTNTGSSAGGSSASSTGSASASGDELVTIMRSLEVVDVKSAQQAFKNLAQELCEYAVQIGSKDNVTAVIILFEFPDA